MKNEKTILLPKSDYIFKRIFADRNNTDILESFLKSVLNLPAEDYKKLEIADTHLQKNNADDKLGILDIKIYTATGKIVNIEIQVLNTKSMTDRVIFYASKMVTEQISAGQDHSTINTVIGIIITDYILMHDSHRYHNCYKLYDIETNSVFSNKLEIHTLELPKLAKNTDNSKLFQWLSFLNAKRKEEFEMLSKNDPDIEKAYNVLKDLSADEIARMEYDARQKWLWDQRSREEAAEAIGEARGAIKERRNFINKLLRKGMSISQISEYTDIPVDEIEKIQKD